MPKPMVVTATPCSAARPAMRVSSSVLVMPMLGCPSENRMTWLICQGWNALNTWASPARRPPEKLVPPPSTSERTLAMAKLRLLESIAEGGIPR